MRKQLIVQRNVDGNQLYDVVGLSRQATEDAGMQVLLETNFNLIKAINVFESLIAEVVVEGRFDLTDAERSLICERLLTDHRHCLTTDYVVEEGEDFEDFEPIRVSNYAGENIAIECENCYTIVLDSEILLLGREDNAN